LIGKLLYAVPLAGAGGTRSGSKLRAAATITRSLARHVMRDRELDRQMPIVLIASGARLVERDGRYFNSISDYFFSLAPDRTLAIEDLFHWKWPFPRHHENVVIKTPLLVDAEVKARLRASRYRRSARALVELLRERTKDLFSWSFDADRCRRLEAICANRAASLAPRCEMYRSIFKRTRARILVKEEACYGGPDDTGALVAARDLGMVTAELQHGAISSGHDAYNFAPAVLADEAYRGILPEYLLAYGDWWGNQINAPVKSLAIGSPHRTETLGNPHFDAAAASARRVLVLGDGIETGLYLAFCERLADALDHEFAIAFRPHPLERAQVWKTYPRGAAGRIRIDSHDDIYTSFRQAGTVVTEVSTGLFEAIGLVPKIFIWDTPKSRFTLPVHPFHRFADTIELATLIRDQSTGLITANLADSFWAPQWQRNYREFIEMATSS
jgi:hypothetical protein